jgi:NADH dehydrogenase [ubiquinone] 1 alpha subcomplex assembly factor 7
VSAEGEATLGELIDMQIRTHGPMSIANYMALCLTHPARGYYRGGDPLGKAGDFVTAPEISQMFGELIGFFVVNLWQQMNEPAPFALMELGPGRGTLMSDIMRVAARAPGFAEAVQLKLYETSPSLVEAQRQRLGSHAPEWLSDLDALPDMPLIALSNEFFDALPIRQFVRGQEGWHERQVGLRNGVRAFGLSPSVLPDTVLPPAVKDAQPGEVYELALAGAEVMNRLSRHVAAKGGAVLAIDYGYARTQTGETLQAVRDHAYADPLADPGLADISAHVDFEALAGVARRAGLAVQPLATQGEFLGRLGLGERARALAAANPEQATDIVAAAARLAGAEQMGTLFKVFCASSPGLQPPGFMP